MPMIGNRYYANPAYGRAMEEAREADAANTAESGHGHFQHVEVHPSEQGGYHVLAHFHHPAAGHHVVHSHHEDHAGAASAVHHFLRAHARKNP